MNAISELSFEAAYAELERIIAHLESGELPLEESVTLYERGRQLAERCQAALDQAELRVSQLTGDGRVEPL
jgi:exodeoxyribonuclease VII small subunit